VRVSAGVHERSLDLQPDGTFVSWLLPAGPGRVELLLQAGSGRWPVDGFARDVTIDPTSPARVRFDLGAMHPASVHGRVRAEQPLPPGLAIEFRIEGDRVQPMARADVGANGRYEAGGLWPGTYRVAFRFGGASDVLPPAFESGTCDVPGGETRVDLPFAHRRLTVRFVRPDGTPVRGQRLLARCGGAVWPQLFFRALVVDEVLVLDPAPALPIEFGGYAGAAWSQPVGMPEGHLEAEVTVVLPGS
jgi:hypothetical protein